MQVQVLFFGVLRDLLGRDHQTLEVAPGSTVADVLARCQELAGPAPSSERDSIWNSLAIAVNQEYARSTDTLQRDDEVALLPPVSGGLNAGRVALTREAIATHDLVAGLKQGEDGAVVVFDGIVRNNTRKRRTLYLDYEAYEAMALDQMQRLAEEARQRFAVRAVTLVHRLGRLEVGETSVLIAVAAAHRGAAFDGCRWCIDTLKKTVPIWKKEYFVDGAVWADGEPFPEALRAGEAS